MQALKLKNLEVILNESKKECISASIEMLKVIYISYHCIQALLIKTLINYLLNILLDLYVGC